ncbi:uncharacterized protein FIBRA_07493 [Fibroporia radiculosa]|uniref:C2H2-type domain-containing protein n=1 Tax=Fibroporia radiculosa TaxID=599839 RepID=J4IBU7_9APHY|nr:uncharacterized protein FIBRA_07493 [Fibroporia radiculosa]CCM05281.1 predicted protein [Fibroporia radiculosa]
MTRKQITQLAIDIDTTNIVTDPSHLLHDSGAPPEAFAICATELSFNGRKYECFLCHHEYKTLSALNQHLASPVHDADIYWCPKDWQGCGTKFRVLSALCQHVESERCGIRRFKDPMQEVIGEDKELAV